MDKVTVILEYIKKVRNLFSVIRTFVKVKAKLEYFTLNIYPRTFSQLKLSQVNNFFRICDLALQPLNLK